MSKAICRNERKLGQYLDNHLTVVLEAPIIEDLDWSTKTDLMRRINDIIWKYAQEGQE